MKGIIVILLTFLAFTTRLPKAEASENIQPNSSLNANKRNLTAIESWEKLEKNLKYAVNSGVKMILPILMDNSAKLNLSKECVKNSLHLLSGVKSLRPWAIRFLDSSAKIIDGMVTGSVGAFGIYEECLNTEVKSARRQDEGKILYRGKYCFVDMKPYMPLRTKDNVKFKEEIQELRNHFAQRDTVLAEAAKFSYMFYSFDMKMGICVPSGCSTEDIDKIAHMLGDAVTLDIKASHCEVKEENNFSPSIIAVLTCYSFVAFLMLVGSLIDVYAYYRKIDFKNKFFRILVAFSLFTNFRKFVNTESKEQSLSCLNGLRFLSMSWIICGHTYLITNYQMYTSLTKITDVAGEFAFQVIINGTLAVDTFFCIGSFLLCYLTIKHCRIQGHRLKIGLYIFHRIFRIYPVYIFVIMFVMLLPLLGSGPMWYRLDDIVSPCQKYWWKNLLFINNFFDGLNTCIPQSWYIAADFQLYVGALIILIPMIKWPKAGIFLSLLVIIISILYCGVVTYMKDLGPTRTADLSEIPSIEIFKDDWFAFYIKPFVHASPYCIGLLTGYLYATKPDLKIPPLIQVIGWSLAFIFNFSSLYGTWEWNRGQAPSVFDTIMYASLYRTAWTLGVAWIIICCATGHGGIVNYILSWKAFIPLGRLTYVAYLIHPLVQLIYAGNVKSRSNADHFLFVWRFFGHLCVTYILAFFGSMLIESPFMSLEKLFVRREKEPENKSQFKENIDLNGSFTAKNGDICSIVIKNNEQSEGTDNGGFVIKL